MQKDVHFHAVHKLAEQAGFKKEDAYKMAFCSQFVDDCNDIAVEKARIEQLVYTRLIGISFNPTITQTNILNAVDPLVQRYVILPFHFIPGNRKDPMGIVTPHSDLALSLVNIAIRSRNVFELGVALHTYMDTWSHQGFTAFEHQANRVVNWKTAYREIVPNIGHADIGNDCDIVEGVWFDYRKAKGERKIINKARFYQCFGIVFTMLKSAFEGKLIPIDIKEIKDWDANGFWAEWVDTEDYEDRIDLINVERNYRMDDPHFHNEHYIDFQMAAKKQIAAVFSSVAI